jgi:hypothetical protein
METRSSAEARRAAILAKATFGAAPSSRVTTFRISWRTSFATL